MLYFVFRRAGSPDWAAFPGLVDDLRTCRVTACGRTRCLCMRPYLIALGLLGALIAMILVGNSVYQRNGSLFGESPAKSVSLKESDLPSGMKQCISGSPQGKGGDTLQFAATDAWTAVYADDCNVPPSRRYAFTSVLEFDSETAAVAAYTAFIGSQDCTIAHGCVDWGLGQNFNLNCGTTPGDQSGTVSCLGTWQRKTFMVTFQGILGSIDEAKKAVLDMDARAQQMPST
jgi:hypothetical protein